MTGQEIVQALRCTSTPGGHTSNCEQCPYWKKEQLNGRLKEKLGTDTWTSCDVDKVGLDAADLIERLTAENAALLGYAKLFAGCDMCRHSNYCKTDCPCDECEQDVKGNCYCKDCERGSNWEWRGLPDAPEGGDKHE